VFLVGDVPVGVSIYSEDVWAQPHLFDLQRSCGAPPEKVFQSDPFTMQWGQNWGFPLYDWFAMSKDNFLWWRRRLRSLREIFSILRVDHALGFFRIYSFPWRPERNEEFTNLSADEARERTGGLLPGFVPHEDDTPEHMEANRVHGETLLGILAEETGREGLIAEDLGEVPPYVRPTLARMGLAGFKIPQWETEPDGFLTPGAAYPRVSITTYATHDHPPLCHIWDDLVTRSQGSPGSQPDSSAKRELRALVLFCGGNPDAWENHRFDFQVLRLLLGGLWQSNSWLAAANINDLFGTPDRFNVPGTSSSQNWSARLQAPVHSWNTVHSAAIAAWKSTVVTQRSAR
jgi:4-alpha-glucanotransferase